MHSWDVSTRFFPGLQKKFTCKYIFICSYLLWLKLHWICLIMLTVFYSCLKPLSFFNEIWLKSLQSSWIIGKAREFQKNIYFCFTDYAKAFDCVHHSKQWKILQEIGIPDHLTCLLRNLYAGQEAIVITGRGTTDWFQIGKGVRQGCILSPCLFNLYAEYITRNAVLDEAQAGIKIAGRNIKTSDMQMTPPLWQKVKKN